MSEEAKAQSLSSRWARRPAGTGLAIVSALVINFGHWLYGAHRAEAAMAFTLASAAMVLAVLLTPALRQDLMKGRRLAWPITLFGLTVLAVLWSLTPWVPGGPHPAWSYVGERGFASIDPSSTVVELVKLLGLSGLFIVGVSLGASDKRAQMALSVTVYSGAAFSAWMFLAYVTGDPATHYGRRLAGHFLSANTPATLVGMLAVLALSLALRRARQAPPRERIAAVAPASAATLVLLITLICTASRAGMAATAVGMMIVLAGEGARSGGKWKAATIGLVGIAALASLVAFAGDQLIVRFFNASKDLDVRGLLVGVHWKAFLASPINGYGLGSFNAVNRIYLDPENFAVLWNVNATHNVYVQWLEEGGLAAALPMFATIAWVLAILGFVGLRRERMRGWIFALLACSAVVLLHGWTDFALQVPSVAGLWAFLLGIGFSLAQGSRRGAQSGPKPAAVVASGLGAAVASIGAVLVLVALPSGDAKVGGVSVLKLAIGYDRAAERELANGTTKTHLDNAQRASMEAQKLFPFDTSAWLRLVYIDHLRLGRMKSGAASLFERSYDLVAYDPYVARWRIRFGLENWTELTPDSRESVAAEAKLLLEDQGFRRYVTDDLKAIRSPSGRMVASFWLNQVGGAQR
ncbi:O-antigen ligase family protein [Caulobacter sp. 73W]|uniref:O-antigen ligase family protein n=1 Tax=Caulobacter sp. 73W TaxID=3161137 RepID=A0AB39KX07_9CAUL